MNNDFKTFDSMESSTKKPKWYERSLLVILALIFIYPVGLALMWGFKKWKLWIRVVITCLFVIVYLSSLGNNDGEKVNNSSNQKKQANNDLKKELKNVNAENKDLKKEIKELENNNDKEDKKDESSKKTSVQNDVNKGSEIEKDTKEPAAKQDTNENKPNREAKAALGSAKTYADTMHMSKDAIYDQLTSSAGDKYPEDAAQYAVDNLEADYNENALKSAENYLDMMDMSDDEIYSQLTSDAGDKFTPDEAKYAVDHLED